MVSPSLCLSLSYTLMYGLCQLLIHKFSFRLCKSLTRKWSDFGFVSGIYDSLLFFYLDISKVAYDLNSLTLLIHLSFLLNKSIYLPSASNKFWLEISGYWRNLWTRNATKTNLLLMIFNMGFQYQIRWGICFRRNDLSFFLSFLI